MTSAATIHRFTGEFFALSVERHEATGNVTIRVRPSEGMQWQQLSLFELSCTPAEADELSKLLRPAAALAQHVARGGDADGWRLF